MSVSTEEITEADPTRAATPKAARQPKLSTAVLNFWIDAALFITLAVLMWVSVMLQVIFPAPTETAGWQLWGLSYDQWRNVQFGALCVFALLAIEHMVLHWNWICTMLATRILGLKKPDEGVQAVYGVGTFIVLLILTMGSILAAMFAVQRPPL